MANTQKGKTQRGHKNIEVCFSIDDGKTICTDDALITKYIQAGFVRGFVREVQLGNIKLTKGA